MPRVTCLLWMEMDVGIMDGSCVLDPSYCSRQLPPRGQGGRTMTVTNMAAHLPTAQQKRGLLVRIGPSSKGFLLVKQSLLLDLSSCRRCKASPSIDQSMHVASCLLWLLGARPRPTGSKMLFARRRWRCHDVRPPDQSSLLIAMSARVPANVTSTRFALDLLRPGQDTAMIQDR